MQKGPIYSFRGRFSFLQDQANFWQNDLFCHEQHHSVIMFLLIYALFSRNNVCKKAQFSKGIWRPSVEQKQKKPAFVLLNDEVTEAWYLPLVDQKSMSFIIQDI